MIQSLRVLLIAAFVAFAINLAPQAAGTADAAGCVKIYRIYYDSPGSDSGSNSSLNAEWVQLKSKCSVNKSLAGYKLRDKANHWYTFGAYTLRAGTKVKIHTGSGADTLTDRYQGLDGYVWNNDGDKAFLYNSAGTLVQTCAYAGGSPGYKYC